MQLYGYGLSIIHQHANVLRRHLVPQRSGIGFDQFETLFFSSCNNPCEPIQTVSSDVSSARRILSNSFESFSSVSSPDCFVSSSSFVGLCLLRRGGSIVQIFCSCSLSSVVVVVTSISITITSFCKVSLGCAGDMMIGTGDFVFIAASNSRVLLGAVIDSPPSSCPKERCMMSASFYGSSDNCHITRDFWRVSLSERSLFLWLPLMIFRVLCNISLTSSSSRMFKNLFVPVELQLFILA